ncbi:hypothetical protein [Kitasatospora sp. NPDC089509]|uniref:hypothetical protein n=1 Tax=Kitasatospora sp. NPDC089509 TaxID=3364079 RepID=UPI003805A21D
MEERRRRQYPSDEQIVERRTWTDEENARWEELRAAERTTIKRMAAHPAMDAISRDMKLRGKLGDAAPMPEVTVRDVPADPQAADSATRRALIVRRGGVETEEELTEMA